MDELEQQLKSLVEEELQFLERWTYEIGRHHCVRVKHKTLPITVVKHPSDINSMHSSFVAFCQGVPIDVEKVELVLEYICGKENEAMNHLRELELRGVVDAIKKQKGEL
jgi:hypothetical protein